MSGSLAVVDTYSSLDTDSIRSQVEATIDSLMNSLPAIGELDAAGRRGILGRYSAVLEGNFIYWMTGAYLSAKTDEAKAIIIDNLTEEVRDSHPAMLRRFAIAANAVPTEVDSAVIYDGLTKVRLFVGRRHTVPLLITMAFFEGFIQKFMAYLSELAAAQGSTDFEYADVHGVCDVAHSEGLFEALHLEMALQPAGSNESLFEGVGLLSSLISTIVSGEQPHTVVVAAR